MSKSRADSTASLLRRRVLIYTRASLRRGELEYGLVRRAKSVGLIEYHFSQRSYDRLTTALPSDFLMQALRTPKAVTEWRRTLCPKERRRILMEAVHNRIKEAGWKTIARPRISLRGFWFGTVFVSFDYAGKWLRSRVGDFPLTDDGIDALTIRLIQEQVGLTTRSWQSLFRQDQDSQLLRASLRSSPLKAVVMETPPVRRRKYDSHYARKLVEGQSPIDV